MPASALPTFGRERVERAAAAHAFPRARAVGVWAVLAGQGLDDMQRQRARFDGCFRRTSPRRVPVDGRHVVLASVLERGLCGSALEVGDPLPIGAVRAEAHRLGDLH